MQLDPKIGEECMPRRICRQLQDLMQSPHMLCKIKAAFHRVDHHFSQLRLLERRTRSAIAVRPTSTVRYKILPACFHVGTTSERQPFSRSGPRRLDLISTRDPVYQVGMSYPLESGRLGFSFYVNTHRDLYPSRNTSSPTFEIVAPCTKMGITAAVSRERPR